MDNPLDIRRSSKPQSTLLQAWPWMGVLLVIILVGFVRYRLLDMPLERDEGEYAYAGQMLLQGIPPYSQAWNMKLPGTYFAYACGMLAFGQTIAGVHATLMAVNSLTIIFVFLLGRKLFGPLAGVFACACFGILSVSPAVMGMAGHANHFVIFFAVPATYLLCKAMESGELRTLFLSGLLYGMGFLMKQQGICFCVFAIPMVLWSAVQSGGLFSFTCIRRLFAIGIGMLVPFGLACLYFKYAGVFDKFWFWTATYAHSYATEVTPQEGLAKFLGYFDKKWPIYIGFLGFIGIALPAIAWNRAYRPQIIFAMMFALFSLLATAIDFNFREHYFILLLPALAVLFGLGAVALFESGGPPVKVVSVLGCLGIVGFCVYMQRPFFFQLPAGTISQIIYSGDTPFTEVPAVGDYIRDHSKTKDTVAVVGSEPEIYFYAERHSATGFMYTYPMMETQPYASQMQHDMIKEIEMDKPTFLVFVNSPDSWNVRPASDKTVFKWFPKYANGSYDRVAALYQSDPDAAKFVAGNGLKTNQISASEIITVFRRKPSAL